MTHTEKLANKLEAMLKAFPCPTLGSAANTWEEALSTLDNYHNTKLEKASMGRVSKSIELDGLEVELFRGRDGKLVVELATGGLESKDVHLTHDIPNIRIWVNEEQLEISPEGNYIVDGKEVTA